MIQKAKTDRFGRVAQELGHLRVRRAGLKASARMVMCDTEGGTADREHGAQYIADGYQTAVGGAFGQRDDA